METFAMLDKPDCADGPFVVVNSAAVGTLIAIARDAQERTREARKTLQAVRAAIKTIDCLLAALELEPGLRRAIEDERERLLQMAALGEPQAAEFSLNG